MGLVNVEFYGGEQLKISELFDMMFRGGRALGYDVRCLDLDNCTVGDIVGPLMPTWREKLQAPGAGGFVLACYTDRCRTEVIQAVREVVREIPDNWTLVLVQTGGEPRSVFEKARDPREE